MTIKNKKDIELILMQELSNDVQDQIPYLSSLLLLLLNQSLSVENFERELKSKPSLENAFVQLKGKRIPLGSEIVSFGQGSQIGDVTIRDVAGNNLTKIEINVNLQSENRSKSRQVSRKPSNREVTNTSLRKEGSVVASQNETQKLKRCGNLHLLPGKVWRSCKIATFPLFGLMCGWFTGYNIVTSSGRYRPLEYDIVIPIVSAIIGLGVGLLIGLELSRVKRRASGVSWWGHVIGICVTGFLASSVEGNMLPGAFWVIGVLGWGAIWFFLLNGFKELR